MSALPFISLLIELSYANARKLWGFDRFGAFSIDGNACMFLRAHHTIGVYGLGRSCRRWLHSGFFQNPGVGTTGSFFSGDLREEDFLGLVDDVREDWRFDGFSSHAFLVPSSVLYALFRPAVPSSLFRFPFGSYFHNTSVQSHDEVVFRLCSFHS